MTIYVGIDNTSNTESVGTAKFARKIAEKISDKYPIYAVSRHQFYVHPTINYSSYNFGAVIHLDCDDEFVDDIFLTIKRMIEKEFNIGSNPGLAVAHEDQISPAVINYGQEAKKSVISQKRAIKIAKNSNIKLEGFGKTKDGVIGAIASIGLAATKNDGRFLQIGNIRTIKDPQPVENFIKAGVEKIFTLDGLMITNGIIYNDNNKPVKPSPINGESYYLF
jgi:tRNA(Ile2) C34 agmatinyltransferase TiaS